MNFIFVLPIKMAISPGAVTGGNLINLSAVEKTKRKNIIELQYCTGMSLFFFHFQKIGSGGSEKRKIKTSSPKGNDRSPENKQVFLNSSVVSKRFFQLVKGSQLCSPWLTKF